MLLIVPLVASSQNLLTTIEISVLRRAAILISEGDECKEASKLKDAQIKELHYQVDHLTGISHAQDSIIFRKDNIISSKDLIIINQEDLIEISEKKVKKHKRITIGAITLAVVFLLL